MNALLVLAAVALWFAFVIALGKLMGRRGTSPEAADLASIRRNQNACDALAQRGRYSRVGTVR